MREAIEWAITFACDHPAMIGLISLVWGVLAGWTARVAWESLSEEDAVQPQEGIIRGEQITRGVIDE